MRTVTALVLAVLAGVLAVLAIAGSRIEALVHTPGPAQEIAGPMARDPELGSGLARRVEDVVGRRLPDAVPSFLAAPLLDLVGGAVDGLVGDGRFAQAWSRAVEQTRVDWVDRLERIESAPGTGTPPDDGTVHLQLAPLAELGVDRLAESVAPLPGGEAAARALREGAGEALAGTGDGGSSPLSVDLGTPDPARVDPRWVATGVSLLPQWPWLAVGAVVAAVLALVLAPRGRRWLVLVAAGATVLAAGAAGRWGLERADVGAVDGLARLAARSLLDGVREYAIPDTVTLMAGGALVAVLGLVAGLVSRARRR
ncbi:hypothetical protein E7744_04915 [Citricoccus sp. SGAir0253]|uniref:hypothetical protein n=1 Tax=Citricoccus sp. SGAir0253 TaxID=2567881 RepID=UPI0010CD2988|nr:hypothetical protein [Citricoccus sp. SGAir0253]QCU77626.1 hypothetical protein E7744_04915 [Citricoccus sp. SGAir0253]